MRKTALPALLLSLLALAACAKKPDVLAAELLKAGDRLKALQVLEDAAQKKPDQATTHYLLFQLNEYLALQGEPAKHDAYLNAAIGEYSWIAKSAGLSPDYRDMDGSLKSTDATRSAYQAAYDAVYAR